MMIKKNRNSVNKNPLSQIKENDKQVPPIDQKLNEGIIKELEGKIGLSKQWKSGWIDLNEPTNFYKGDSLSVIVGGTAKKIILRLLSSNNDPNSPIGIVGRIHEVNGNGEVNVRLSKDYSKVIQISVHGGENPWGVYPLGLNNAAAFIQSVRLIR